MLANWKWHGSWSFKSQNRRRTWNGMPKKKLKRSCWEHKEAMPAMQIETQKAETTCFKKMQVAKKTSRKLGELCFWWLSLTDSSWTCKFQGIFVAKQTYLVISNLPIGNSQTDEPTKTEKQFGTWKISAMVRYTKTPLTCKGCFFPKLELHKSSKIDYMCLVQAPKYIVYMYIHVWNCKCWIPKISLCRFSVDSQSLCT